MNVSAMRDLSQVDPIPHVLGERVETTKSNESTKDRPKEGRIVTGPDGKLETRIPENEVVKHSLDKEAWFSEWLYFNEVPSLLMRSLSH